MELVSFLRCKVGDGEKPDERAICFSTADGNPVMAFVHKDFIYENRLCRVREVSRAHSQVRVTVPTPTFGTPVDVSVPDLAIEFHY